MNGEPEKQKFSFSYEWMHVLSFSNTKSSHSFVAKPRGVDDCLELVDYAKSKKLSICPKGSGYSYSDIILNDKEILCDTSCMSSLLAWDSITGIMVVEPGFKLNKALYISLSDNWTLRACPAVMGITIAGALSSNVHGKDCSIAGCFGDQVIQFKLITSSGSVLVVDKKNNKELFNAVIGGMGLLGILSEITLQLFKVQSPYVEVTTTPTKNLSATLEVLENSKSSQDFSVAWVDSFSIGKSIGRGFVISAKWIDLPRATKSIALKKSLTISTKIFDLFPSKATWNIVKPFFGPKAIKLVNTVNYYQKFSKGVAKCITLFPSYNFIHNKIPNLESIYKPEGFYEFQPLLPRVDGEQSLLKLLKLGHKYSSESLLCAIKMHKADDYLLSYSLDGYSIGIDIQKKNRDSGNIKKYANELFELTGNSGGKIYLSKDELLSSIQFKNMYEKHAVFMQVKNRIDNVGLFKSDMYRRLFP